MQEADISNYTNKDMEAEQILVLPLEIALVELIHEDSAMRVCKRNECGGNNS